MSIDVKIEDYCQDCTDFVVHDYVDVAFSYDGNQIKRIKHLIACENHPKCKIEKHIREVINNAPKKKN